MKIVITMGLANRNAEHFLEAIAKSDLIDEIFVVRNSPANHIEKVTYVTTSKKVPSFCKPLVKLFQLFKISIKEKPSYIHSFLLSPHGYLAFLVGKLTGRKTGISFLAGPVELFDLELCNLMGKYPFLPYCESHLSSKKVRIIKKYLLDKFDNITVTGTYTRDFLIHEGISDKKISILPHFVDERFKLRSLTKIYDIIYVGRLAKVKHIETFLYALVQVKSIIPTIKAVVVGNGEEEAILKKLAEELNLQEPTLSFMGYQTDVWEWYSKSKLSILSSDREGFPYSVIESLKCGVPVISSNCGDVVDIIHDGYNGRLIQKYDDINEFANSIIDLLQHPNLLEEFSKNAVESVKDINQEKVTEVWEKQFKEMGLE